MSESERNSSKLPQQDIVSVWHKIESYSERPTKWMLNIILASVPCFLISEHVFPAIFEKIKQTVDLTPTLLGILIFLITALLRHMQRQSDWLKSRSVDMEGRFNGLNRVMKAGPLRHYPTERKAYDALLKISEGKIVKMVDLLQFSGQTALHFLEEITDSAESARVRLLIFDPKMEHCYDRDKSDDYHIRRIHASMTQIATFSGKDRIEIRFYQCEPSVCSVLIDDKVASLGWYRRYLNKSGNDTHMLLSSHDGTTIVDDNSPDSSLRDFARRHFDTMWKTAKPTIEC